MATKVCTRCQVEKDTKEFYTHTGHTDGLASYCIECHKIAMAVRKSVYKTLVRQYLSSHGCKDCGNMDHRVLEFDHVNGFPNGDVTTLIRSHGWNSQIVKDEIAKCEIRCANCHAIRHWVE